MRHTLLIMALLAAHAGEALADNEDGAAQAFQASDQNADQALDYAEFLTFVELGAAAGLGRLSQVAARGLEARAFERLDANGDTLVTPEELRAIR